MATIVNMHQAKASLSRLVERALAGEEIVIARNGEPLIQLAPVPKKAEAAKVEQGPLTPSP
jgi:prevent-host-death family protein